MPRTIQNALHQRRNSTFLDIIQDEDSFAALIRRERERSDRTKQDLSLIIFDCEGKDNREARDICESIKRDIRTIDDIGRMDEKRFGVLLPATNREGAQIFSERAACGRIAYTIFTYPEQWSPDYKPDQARPGEDAAGSIDGQSSLSLALPPWKRGLDIVGSLLGLALLWPIFLLVGAFIKIVSPGPVFFTQKRVGQGGKLFTFIKFRTMKFGNDQAEHQEHIVKRIRAGESLEKLDSHDSRIILGGKALRRLCIDELPQLINVLKGDMSLVGPRPCVPYEAQEFLMWHTHRFDAVPGMTGLWQVSGKNKLTFTQMIRLDIAYANHMSLKNDLVIILRTFPTVAGLVLESLQRKMGKGITKINDAIYSSKSACVDGGMTVDQQVQARVPSLTRVG